METLTQNQVKSKGKRPYKKAEYEEYVRFTAIPRVLRDKDFGFHTDEAFIRHYKLSSSTVYEWKKDQGFWNEVQNTLTKWGKDRTPDVIYGLYRTAVQKGGASEVMAWMKLFEGYTDQSNVNVQTVSRMETLKDIQNNTRKLVEQESQKAK